MLVDIWLEYSWLTPSAPQKQEGGEPPGHKALSELSITATAIF